SVVDTLAAGHGTPSLNGKPSSTPKRVIDTSDPDVQLAYLTYRQQYLQPGDKSDPALLAQDLSRFPESKRANKATLLKMDPIGQLAILDRAQELEDERNGIPSMRAEPTGQRPKALSPRKP